MRWIARPFARRYALHVVRVIAHVRFFLQSSLATPTSLWMTATQRSPPPVIVARFEFTFDEYLAP